MNLNEKDSGIVIFDIKEQEERIVSFYGDKERIAYITSEFRSAETINGTVDEFINFSLHFARNGNHLVSCEILSCGIKKYPYNVELLSCFLNCAIDSGDSNEIVKCEDIYTRLREIPLTRYSERAFYSILKYLAEKRTNVRPKEEFLVLQDAHEILDVFKRQYPESEGGYFAQCDFIVDNNAEEIKTILKKAVAKLSSCPKCALKLADILCAQGNYLEACHVIEKCLTSVQTLSNVNKAYVYFLSGICEYGLLMNMDAGNERNEEIKAKIKKIYTVFRISRSDYYNLHSVYKKEIERIIYVIEQQFGVAYS